MDELIITLLVKGVEVYAVLRLPRLSPSREEERDDDDDELRMMMMKKQYVPVQFRARRTSTWYYNAATKMAPGP